MKVFRDNPLSVYKILSEDMSNTEEFNPYAPPQSIDLESHETASVYWTKDNVLIVPLGQERFPHRCVYCNEPVKDLLKRTYYWHNPFIYLLIIINLLLYLIVALIARKRVTVQIGLCNFHNKKRIKQMLIGWGIFFLSVACFFTDIIQVTLIGIITLIGSMFYLNRVSRIVYISKIKDNCVYFKKCSRAFLEGIQKLTSQK